MDKENVKRPIFVVGHSRSGSTLLATLLGRHSRILALPETHFFGGSYSGFFLRRFWSYRSIGSLLRFTVDDNIRLRDLGLHKESIKSSLISQPDINSKSILDCIFSSCLKSSKKQLVLEKTPYHIEHVDRILKWYPEARIICIVRDGRDAIDSQILAPWTHSSPKRHALYWAWCVKRSIKLQRKYPESVTIVRYEDLVMDPSSTLRKLASHIGVDFEPEILNEINDASTVPLWELGWKGESKRAIDSNKAFKWLRNDCHQYIEWTSWMSRELKILDYDISLVSRVRKIDIIAGLSHNFFYGLWLVYRTHFKKRSNKFRRSVESNKSC